MRPNIFVEIISELTAGRVYFFTSLRNHAPWATGTFTTLLPRMRSDCTPSRVFHAMHCQHVEVWGWERLGVAFVSHRRYVVVVVVVLVKVVVIVIVMCVWCEVCRVAR